MHMLALALRNLTRHSRRTLITTLAVAFGALAIVCLQAIANGFVKNLIENSVLNKVGAVQVFKRGYLGSDDPLAMSFADDEALQGRIRAVPGVAALAPRLDFDGMLSNGSDATMFVATAIDPRREYQVCPRRASYLARGSQPLGPGDERSAVIGKQLVDSLGAMKGSTLVMQAAGAHAATNALDVQVHGFLPHTHPVESKRLATVPLAFAQELLRMKGQVTEYVVGVAELGEVEAVAARVRGAVGDGFEVTTWRQIDIGTRDRAPLLQYILDFIAVVLFFLVSTGIVNTMMMSVHERVREIGTMLAVGVRRWQVTVLFLLEATLLGLGSAILGTGAGVAVVQVVARRGIETKLIGDDVVVVFPFIGASSLGLIVALTVLGTVLAAAYPTWKAARLRPVDALRST
jgi:putative ABC transport system permease protein